MRMVVTTDEKAKAPLEQNIVQSQEKIDDDDRKLPAVEEKLIPTSEHTTAENCILTVVPAITPAHNLSVARMPNPYLPAPTMY